MPDIIHRIGIQSSASNVYKAIATIEGLRNWWTEEVEGEEQTGSSIEFTFRSEDGDVLGVMKMQVTELIDEKSIRWKCTEGPEEWIGTDITFDLVQHGDQIVILFGHRNWREPVEFMAHCSMKWAVFLLSLREYVETGEGKPSPNDLKIDNWN